MNTEISFIKHSNSKYKRYKNIKKIQKLREQKQKNKLKSKQKKYNTEQKTNEQTASIGFTHAEKRYIGINYCEKHHNNWCMCWDDDWSDWTDYSDYDRDYDFDSSDDEEDFDNSDEEAEYHHRKYDRKQKICDRHHRKYSRSCYYCNFLNPFEPILETTYAAGTGDLDYLKELHTSQISHKWDIYTTYWSAQNDHIDCFKYALEYGCPYNWENCYWLSIHNGKIRQFLKEHSPEKIKKIQKLKSCEILYERYNIPKDVVKYIILPYW